VKPLELIEQGRFLGEEFLLWVWWRGLTEGGTSGSEGDTSAIFVDDPINLVGERGDVKAISLHRGNPAESREAFEALSRGMRPCRAKMRLLFGDMEWTFSIAAASLDYSGLKMPPSQAKDSRGRVADRIFLLEEFLGHMERRFARFLESRSGNPETLLLNLKTWIRTALKGAGETGEEAPWES
jgi:recombination associated protein RdgC